MSEITRSKIRSVINKDEDLESRRNEIIIHRQIGASCVSNVTILSNGSRYRGYASRQGRRKSLPADPDSVSRREINSTRATLFSTHSTCQSMTIAALRHCPCARQYSITKVRF